MCADGTCLTAVELGSDCRQLWAASSHLNSEVAAGQLRLYSFDEANGRMLRCHALHARITSMAAHNGSLYLGGHDGTIWRHSEITAQPAVCFKLGSSSAITSITIDPSTRASWGANGSTARGRPALLVYGCHDGACAAELPLRQSGQQTTFCMDQVASVALQEGMGSASTEVSTLATFSLPGDLPGAAARAVLCGEVSGVLRANSLRDGVGCGALLGYTTMVAPVVCITISNAHVFVGLSTGTILCLTVHATCSDGTCSFAITHEVNAHNASVNFIKQIPLHLVQDEPVSANLASTRTQVTNLASIGADGILHFWRADVGGAGLACTATHQPRRETSAGKVGVAAQPCALIPLRHASTLLVADEEGQISCCRAPCDESQAVAYSTSSKRSTAPHQQTCPAVTSGLSGGSMATHQTISPPHAGAPSAMLGGWAAPAFVHRGAPPGASRPTPKI